MANEINVTVSAKENASDAIRVVGSSTQQAERVIVTSMGSSEEAFDSAARSSGRLGSALDQASGASEQLGGGIGDLGDAVEGLSAMQDIGRVRAQRLAQAQNDVAQAYADSEQAAQDATQAILDANQAEQDGTQSTIDAVQAQIDLETAQLDATDAQNAYNEAVTKFGVNSQEAKRALGELKQANLDQTQAQADLNQAQLDGDQSAADLEQAHRDMTQAQIDAKQAQIDLNDAQKAAKPPTELQKWGENAQLITPMIMGLTGAIDLLMLANAALTSSMVKNAAAQVAQKVAAIAGAAATGIATAAQWLWNAAFAASGIGAIIMLIGLLIAAIIYVATQTTWFQDLWHAIWNKIGDPVKKAFDFVKSYAEFIWGAVADGIKWIVNYLVSSYTWAINTVVSAFNWILNVPGKIADAFNWVAGAIAGAFKWAFNQIAWAWNNTAGRLSFTMPDWIPGMGGNSFSMPRLPTLDTGGDVMKTGAAVVHKGERVLNAQTTAMLDTALGAPQGNAGGGSLSGTLTLELEAKAGASEALMRELIKMLSVRIRKSGGSLERMLIVGGTA